MTDDQYHSHPRIGRSGLQLVDKSPRHYWREYLDPNRVRKPPTAAMAFGSLFHTLLLEESDFSNKYVVAPDRWPTKAECGRTIEEQKAEFHAANARKTAITHADLDAAKRLREGVMAHPAARALLEVPGVCEKPILFDHPHTGSPAKAKPDKLTIEANGLILDIKTAQDASYSEFQKSCHNHWYDVQAAWYLDAALVETGEMPKGFVFIVAEKESNECAVYFATPEMINHGRRKYEPVLELYEECRQSGKWHGYSQQIQPITPPAWAIKQLNYKLGANL